MATVRPDAAGGIDQQAPAPSAYSERRDRRGAGVEVRKPA